MSGRIFTLATCCILACSPAWGAPEVGDKAPGIKAATWLNLPEGLNGLSASELKGRIVIVEFWATWCGPCRQSIPHLVEMQKKYGHDMGVLLISLADEPDAKVRPFVRANNMNYIVGTDANSTSKAFGIRGYPTLFVMDPSGKIIFKGHGSDDAEEAVDRALKQTPPKVKALGATTGRSLFSRAHKDSGASNTAGAKDAEIRRNPEAKPAVNQTDATSKCESWLQLARSLASAGKDDEAAKYYQRILNEYPGSKFAEIARRELRS